MHIRTPVTGLVLLILAGGLLAVLFTLYHEKDRPPAEESSRLPDSLTRTSGDAKPAAKVEPALTAGASDSGPAPGCAPPALAASTPLPITGCVRDASGILLAGAFVRATGRQPRGKAPGKRFMRMLPVDPDGRFVFADLDSRYATFLVEGWKPGYCIAKRFARPGDRVEILLHHPGALFGRVTLQGTGAPGVDATVAVCSRNQETGHTRTDEEGRYRISGLPPGEYHASVTPRGGWMLERHESQVIIEAHQDTEADFSVSPGLLVRGRVTDAHTGVPITGARVGRAPDWKRVQNKTETDGDGRFVLDGFPDRCPLRVQAEGYVRFEAVVRSAVKEGREVTQDVRLQRAGMIVGRVVDPGGRGVPGAGIKLDRRRRQDTPGVRADAEGAFCLDGLPVNTEHRLVVFKKRFADRVTEPFTLRPGERRTGFLVRLTRGVRVSGRIRDKSGEPIPNACLHLRPDDWLAAHLDGRWNIRPDAEGRYRIKGLSAGSYSLEVLASGYLGRKLAGLVLAEDSVREDVDFLLEPGRILTGRVVDDEGRPVDRVWVAGRGGSTYTDARGCFTLNGLPPGMCGLSLHKPGYEMSNETVSDEPGDQDLVLVLHRAAGGIHGRVCRSDTGAPVKEFFVRWFHGHLESIRKFSDAEGRYRLEGRFLKAGEYYLEAGTSDGWISQDLVRVDLARGEDSRRVDLAVGAGASLEGRVLTPDGSPLPGAHVTVHSLSGPPRKVAAARTGRLGRFVMRGLVRGEFAVRARHRDWIEAQATVKVGRTRGPEVELRVLEEGGVLEVVAKDGDGTPLVGVEVKIRRPGGEVLLPVRALPFLFPSLTGSGGILERRSLPPGRFRVEVLRTGYQTGRVDVEIHAGVRSRVEAILAPAQPR